MALRRHRAELDGLELSPVDVFDLFEELAASIDVVRLLPNPLEVVREQPSAEHLRASRIAEIERDIVAAEGEWHVNFRYFANPGDARQQRRREAERRYRHEQRRQARWLTDEEG